MRPQQQPAHDSDTVYDDDLLLADGLLRASHRSADGHVAPNQQMHRTMVEATHNMLVLYVYHQEDDGITMREFHVWAKEGKTYERWVNFAHMHALRLTEKGGDIIGVFGWSTRYISIEFMRLGDVLTNIEIDHFRHVEMTQELFNHDWFASDTETED
jgi:hypothetical protein